MNEREAMLLKLARRLSYPLDVEFRRSPGGPYRLRVLRRREVLIEITSRSLDTVQYEFAAAIVAVKRGRMVPEFQLKKRNSAA